MTKPKRVALVTGASTGFGQITAGILAQQNWQVFGTSRKANAKGEDNVKMLQLDVRDNESVKNCAKTILDKAGRIDLLVNNAGYVLNGFIEETTIENAIDQFQTNFFGVVRMTQALLEQMRRQRSGRIINIGSLSGLVGVPYRGFYAASKFALEGYSETLRYELANYGINVSIIEPGFYKTHLGAERQRGGPAIWDYDEIRPMVQNYFEKGIRNGGDPAEVANLIVKIANCKKPKFRYRPGQKAKWIPRIKAILPESWFINAVINQFKLVNPK